MLHSFPLLLRQLSELIPATDWTNRGTGAFSLVEQAWHLADLEVEGYGMRLTRILTEDTPALPDFRGDVVAAQRDYLHLPLGPALDRFASARAANLAQIAAATEEQRARTGEQDGVGTVTFARVAEMMAEHDASHVGELLTLCHDLGIPAPDELRATSPPSSTP
jgi:hypothetical protein